MLITRRSPLTKTENTLDLPVTEEQLRELQSPSRRMIQDIFPNLGAADREFLLTGYTSHDWAVMFPPEADDEDYDR